MANNAMEERSMNIYAACFLTVMLWVCCVHCAVPKKIAAWCSHSIPR
jgi:hypothetical protein